MPKKQTKDNYRQLFGYIAADAEQIKAIDSENHRINFIISSDKIDRHGERVEVQAIADAIKGFAKNPVALACHQHHLDDGNPPVVGSWDTDSFKTRAHYSEMRLNFATDTDLGLEYWKLYSQRHMRAVSIGFRILEAHEEVVGSLRIYVITQIELFEISCVAVGACREALSKLKAVYGDDLLGRSLDRDDPSIADSVTNTVEPINERLLAIEESLDDLKCILVPDSQEYARRQLGTDADPSLAAGDPNGTETVLRQLQSIENLLKGM